MPTIVDLRTLYSFETPDEAIRYLTDKGLDPSIWHWFDLRADMHARTFTVAKAMRIDVLQTIRNALVESMRHGGEREFVKRLTVELQRLGWWGKSVASPDGITAELVQLGSPRRLRTIYRTNVMSAYNTARYRQQLANSRSRPYWQYVAVMDARTRASHAAMHGRVFRFDDPIWRSHYPPCAYNCRCRVRALTEAEIQRRGLRVETSEGHLEQIEQEAGVNPRTGEVVSMPAVRWTGVDAFGRPVSMTPAPGFGANPSLVPWQPDLERYDYDIARWYVGEVLRGPAFGLAWRRVEAGAKEYGRKFGRKPRDAIERAAAEQEYGVRGERYPVAVLSPSDRAMLGVDTQTVLLSDSTLFKQAFSRDGNEIGITDYWRVQDAIERAAFISKDGDEITTMIGAAGQLYAAVLKPVGKGEVFLQSFRRSGRGDIVRLRNQAAQGRIQILRDEFN